MRTGSPASFYAGPSSSGSTRTWKTISSGLASPSRISVGSRCLLATCPVWI